MKKSTPAAGPTDTLGMPVVVDRATFQAEVEALRVREKAHTREGDAIAAARWRLPMVEVDANLASYAPSVLTSMLPLSSLFWTEYWSRTGHISQCKGAVGMVAIDYRRDCDQSK